MNALATTPPDLVPTWLAAIAAVAGVVVAIVAIALTIHQIRMTGAQIRSSAAAESKDSESRTRPYVFAEPEVSIAGAPTCDIVFSNTGKSVARGVTLEVTGAPFASRFDGDKVGPAQANAFGHGFDMAPHTRRRFFWHFPERPGGEPSNAMGAPRAGEITIRYKWAPDDGRAPRSYEEKYTYDLDDLMALAPRAWRGAEASGATEHARNTVLALRAIAGNIGDSNR